MTTLDSTTPLKRCKSCGNEYPETLEYFHSQSCGVNGLRARCKTCINAVKRDKRAARSSRRLLSPEDRLNRDRELDRLRRQTAKRKASNQRYRESDGAKAYAKAYRERPESKARRREYDRVRKANRRAAGGHFTSADIEAIRVAQGNRCYICRKELGNVYQIDHFIPLALGGSSDPGNLRLACPLCNQRKNAKHPHDLGILI
jgi:5-methylcytosine-specific restriction endonuclease McrA